MHNYNIRSETFFRALLIEEKAYQRKYRDKKNVEICMETYPST